MARPAENKLTLFGVFVENLCDYLGLDFENNGNKVAVAITGATSSGRASHYLRPEREKKRQSDAPEFTGYDLNYGFHTATIARMIASSYGNLSYSSRQAIKFSDYPYGKIPLLKTGRDDAVTAQALGEAVDAWWDIDESDECNTRSRILQKGITVECKFFVSTCDAYIRRYASEEAERMQIEDDLWNYVDEQLGTLVSVGGEKMTKTLYRSLLVPILLGPDSIPSMGLLYNVTPRKAAKGDGIECRFELGGQTSLAADGFFLEQVVVEEGTISVANHVDYDKGAAVLLGMEGDDSEVCYFPLPPAGTCCISRSHAWIIPQKDNGGKLRWVLEDCSKNGTVVCGSDGIPKKLSKGEAQCLSDGDEIWLVPGIDRRGNPVPDINRGVVLFFGYVSPTSERRVAPKGAATHSLGRTPVSKKRYVEEPDPRENAGFALRNKNGDWVEYLFDDIEDEGGFCLRLGRLGDHHLGVNSVSREHAAIEPKGPKVYGLVGLSDSGSTNGTSLQHRGEEPCQLHQGEFPTLRDGDTIILADEVRLEFKYI